MLILREKNVWNVVRVIIMEQVVGNVMIQMDVYVRNVKEYAQDSVAHHGKIALKVHFF